MSAANNPALHETVAADGTQIAWWEHGGNCAGEKPTMVFCHATGFHGRVWDAVIEHFPERHIIALDLRGHGRSGGGPVDHWQVFGKDIGSVLGDAAISGAIGIGHSMGAHALLQCAAERPGMFTRLVLFDPVILTREYYEDTAPMRGHPSAKRKRDFASVQEMIDRFADRDPYNLFERRVFEDYCRFGLVPQSSGEGLELACAPEMEASVYESSRSNRAIFDAAEGLQVPTLIVRARMLERMDFKSSPTWPGLADSMPDAQDMYRPDMTHFHPFQDPADAARIISDFMASV